MWLPVDTSLKLMSILVTPISLGALVMLIYVGRRDRRFLEIFPFIFIQINMLFVWICTGAFFWYRTASQCKVLDLRKLRIEVMLSDA